MHLFKQQLLLMCNFYWLLITYEKRTRTNILLFYIKMKNKLL